MFSNNLLWCIWMHNHEILWLKMCMASIFWNIALSHHIVVFLLLREQIHEYTKRKGGKTSKWKIIHSFCMQRSFVRMHTEFSRAHSHSHTSISSIWTLCDIGIYMGKVWIKKCIAVPNKFTLRAVGEREREGEKKVRATRPVDPKEVPTNIYENTHG